MNELRYVETSAGEVPLILAIGERIGTFTPEEIACLGTDLREGLLKTESDAHPEILCTVRTGSDVVGFFHVGHLPMTASTWMLYWILLSPACHGRGLGQAMLAEAERRARQRGATTLLIETSDQPEFAAARALYLRVGFGLAATLADYYAPGNAKCIFHKRLAP